MKNLKGGYKIVSLQQNDLTANFTLDGLYDAIKDSYNKTILVTEIVISGVHKNDAYTLVNKSGTSYVIEVYGKQLTITTADAVTVASLPEITSIGTGLTLTDGELSASGGGGVYYTHSIYLRWNESGVPIYVYFQVSGTRSTKYTSTTFFSSFSAIETGQFTYLANGSKGNPAESLIINVTITATSISVYAMKIADNTFTTYTLSNLGNLMEFVDNVSTLGE